MRNGIYPGVSDESGRTADTMRCEDLNILGVFD